MAAIHAHLKTRFQEKHGENTIDTSITPIPIGERNGIVITGLLRKTICSIFWIRAVRAKRRNHRVKIIEAIIAMSASIWDVFLSIAAIAVYFPLSVAAITTMIAMMIPIIPDEEEECNPLPHSEIRYRNNIYALLGGMKCAAKL